MGLTETRAGLVLPMVSGWVWTVESRVVWTVVWQNGPVAREKLLTHRRRVIRDRWRERERLIEIAVKKTKTGP